ncbi:fluoride efflux transporter CrcB [Epilithonimonas mollis]|uniref:Fluoride-specific ion channel FluC n=1 Tax=Epilithonimonas mollis TaxID=216903 RepID=A0A1M6SME2_9FLAO|nr:fluoride efflux transporter CrcB [Epilithonimonas mollis]SHK45758.1 CrcB protein [Epilithonimonas mollis]
MKNLIYIFLGGGVGSILRFLISNYTQKFWNINAFPLGTFLVNITGCFLIGCLSGYFMKVDNSLKYLLITGLCGGYTTFSTFSAENFSLLQNSNYGILILYSLLSLIIGIMMVFLGFQIIKN